ncbi:MAG: ATP-binding protein [Armatimonadia bacterium]
MMPDIKPRDRDAIIQSLRAGVVPRTGHQHIQVGRADEVTALVGDIDRISDGGAAIRFIIGEYGSGKTFFLFLVRAIALQKKLVATHADLAPERRLYSTGGHARALYAELMRNISTRANPDGGALPSIVERFVSSALNEAQANGTNASRVIQARLEQLSEMVGGYDFAQVIGAYWRGHDTGNEVLKSDAVRWLRAEFSTRTDARGALGVRTIIDDTNAYDHLKLMARFVRLAGFGGFLVCMDEMVNLYKLTNTTARSSNYEQVLRIVNDGLQGISCGLGIMFGGTPEFLTDTRRGLYSYAALQSRLAENSFAVNGLVDYSGPVIRLPNLTPEDFLVLLTRLRHLHACGDVSRYLIPDEALHAFMDHCSSRVGDAYFRTPRNTIKAFLDLLAILEQNPESSYVDLIGTVAIDQEINTDLLPLTDEDEPEATATEGDDDELASFRL